MLNKREYFKQYYIKHKKRLLENIKQWRKNHPEYIKESKKQWYIKNRKRILENSKEYHINNLEHIKELKKQRYKNRYKTDSKFNLNHKISTAIGTSLKSNKAGRHWENLVGYTLDNLIKRLKSTIPEGYKWNDFLKGKLHIDHIIPISIFNFTKSEHMDFKRCWSLNNLQLMPAIENIIKSNKLNKPFQLALAV